MSHHRSYESMHPPQRALLIALASLVALVVVAALATWVMDRWLSRYDRTIPSPIETGGPPLEIHPVNALETSERADRQRLASYGWVNEPAGIAHIPIERAMTLYLERQTRETSGQRP